MIFTVAVAYTDRTRTVSGGFRTFSTHVDVLAGSDLEATCVAAQMAAAIRDGIDGMVIATEIVAVAI